MLQLEILFWTLAATVAYSYALYPLLLTAIRACGRPRRIIGPVREAVSVVLAAHNEASNIQRRVRELSKLASEIDQRSEVIVVCDGSTDDTARLARSAGRMPCA